MIKALSLITIKTRILPTFSFSIYLQFFCKPRNANWPLLKRTRTLEINIVSRPRKDSLFLIKCVTALQIDVFRFMVWVSQRIKIEFQWTRESDSHCFQLMMNLKIRKKSVLLCWHDNQLLLYSMKVLSTNIELMKFNLFPNMFMKVFLIPKNLGRSAWRMILKAFTRIYVIENEQVF